MSIELKRIEHDFSVGDIEIMAGHVARSKLFGLDASQAFTLMLLCQAEGIHPVKAIQRYHVIQGRPAMKSDAMLADFLQIGGTVKWVTESDDKEKCEAVFEHPKFAPEGKSVRFTMADARAAGLTGNHMWQKYPANMMRARVASNGVRMIAPGIVAGLYTPEEVEDFGPPKQRQPRTVEAVVEKPTKSYSEWLDEFCEEKNRLWMEWIGDHHGRTTGKVPAEIVSPKKLRCVAGEEMWANTPDSVQEFAVSEARRLWSQAVKKHLKPVQPREPGADDPLSAAFSFLDGLASKSEDEAMDRIAEAGLTADGTVIKID